MKRVFKTQLITLPVLVAGAVDSTPLMAPSILTGYVTRTINTHIENIKSSA